MSEELARFEPGDRALHKEGQLDSRVVESVDEDESGQWIRLWIGAHLTGWLPAANYDRIPKR